MASVSAPSWGRQHGRPLIIGHRGASACEPENSLPAFARAVRDGADGVELDVIQCATGEVVVFHDDDLRRLGGRPALVTDLPWSELRGLRLLSGASIPLLDEVLDAVAAPALVNIELKTNGFTDPTVPELVDRVASIVARAGASARVLVSSFNPLALWHWRRRERAVATALLFERQAPPPLSRAWSLPILRAQAVNPEECLCTRERVAAWHARGFAVNVWTVDTPARLRELAADGVDGIITNDPAAARRALS